MLYRDKGYGIGFLSTFLLSTNGKGFYFPFYPNF